MEANAEAPLDSETRASVWWEVVILTLFMALPSWISEAFQYPNFPLPIAMDTMLRLAQYIPVCLLAIYFMARSGKDWSHFGLGKNSDFLGLITFVFALIPAGLFVGWIAELLAQAAVGPGAASIDEDNLGTVPYNWSQWVLMWPGLLIGAMFEELVYRGHMTARILDATGRRWLAVLIPSLVFGSVHLYQGVFSAAAITFGGALFSLMFLHWRRLKALILAHFILNVIVLAGYI